MEKNSLIKQSRIISWAGCSLLAFFVIFAYTLPFGASATFSSTNGSIALGPTNRINFATTSEAFPITRQIGDHIYFSTPYPFAYDTATVKVSFRNTNPEQPLEMGYKDKPIWHYDKQPLDSIIAHHPEWENLGDRPTFYQRTNKYDSLEELLNDPNLKTIGTIDYSLSSREAIVRDYYPSTTTTVLDTPLRGSHTMYVYVKDEPFYMKITKQDLNWYDDPDVMVVKIFREQDQVFSIIFDDDGITDSSQNQGPEMVGLIRNPGPGLPETGVYRIVIDASPDIVIKKIETNLHKIVFAGPIYPVQNKEVYPTITKTTLPTTIYTDSSKIVAEIQHNTASQKLRLDGKVLSNLKKGTPQIVVSNKPTSTIIMPYSDVILNGIGYFAFQKNQLFSPNRFHVLPVKSAADLELVDFVIDQYPPPTIKDGFMSVKRTFMLGTAIPEKGRLSWVLSAPDLKAKNGIIEIKDITVTYSSNGWWK